MSSLGLARACHTKPRQGVLCLAVAVAWLTWGPVYGQLDSIVRPGRQDSTSTHDSTPTPAFTTTRVNQAEVLGGPTGLNFDSPFHVFRLPRPGGAPRLVGYNNNGNSFRVLDGDSLNDLVAGPASIGGLGQPIGLNRSLDPDARDHCGCWLQGVAALPDGRVAGFYHEEYHCNYSHNGFTNKSIAYALSEDGGLTYTKVGWPNNQIIQP